MRNNIQRRLIFSAKISLVAVSMVVLGDPALLLPQGPVSKPREAFEVVSVRPTAFEQGGERGGGGGGQSIRPAGEPCGGNRRMLQISPGRFVVNDMTLHSLVAVAYGLNCRPWQGADRLIGGPGWTKSDGFDIQATIPEGTPSYTSDQFLSNKAPELQRMLQTLLVDRFKLALRTEKREAAGYSLTVAKGGLKLQLIKERSFIAAWKEGDRSCCDSSGIAGFQAFKRPVATIARMLELVLAEPVEDRTGLTGEFSFSVGFEPQAIPGISTPTPPGVEPRREPGAPLETRSPAAALEQDLGLKLEHTKIQLDVLVIERVEKLTEN